MSDSVERAVHINFDRDERELAPRDTFVVLTGTSAEPPACDGRRIGDVYLCNVDPVKRTFDAAWFYAGEHGWKQADPAALRAHNINHPSLANRILSISPDGTSVNWSKRDTIIRRERRARTLSRSQSQAAMNEPLSCPKTPPPTGMRSAPVTPQRNMNPGRRPAPLNPAAFVYAHPYAPVSFPPPPPSPHTPRTPHTPHLGQLSPHRQRFPTTPQSSRSSRTAWSSPGSTLFSTPGSRAGYSPPTSLESSPTSPDRSPKYILPQKRRSFTHDFPPIPPPPIFQLPAAPPPLLPSVKELPERGDAVDVFGCPPAPRPRLPQPAPTPRPQFRPDAPPFIPRDHAFGVPTYSLAYPRDPAVTQALIGERVAALNSHREAQRVAAEQEAAELAKQNQKRLLEIDNELKQAMALIQNVVERMSMAPQAPPSPKMSKIEAAILRPSS